MVETLEQVVAKLSVFRERAEACTLAPTLAGVARLVDEAREVLDAFQSTEARHVHLGLTGGSFAFAAAQDELRSWRLGFSRDVQELRRRFAALLSEQEARALGRIDLVARRAPLTSAADLEVIAAGRAARRACAAPA